MRCYVDDIVGPRHDRDIALLVNHPCIPGINPFAVESLQIPLVESLFVLP
jgi:hypothetical protein